jgi:ubiquinone/menaquinone biosynthesis C-methylase UbiE
MNPYKYSLTTRLKEEYILEHMKPQKGDTILDVGCGNGFFSNLFSSKKDCKVVGIDFSLRSLKVANKWYGGKYVQGNALELPFKRGSFTKILLTDVIEHLTDDEKALDEIRRVSRTGASVVITTPALEGPFTGLPLNRLFHNDTASPEYHIKDGYSIQQMKTLLRKKGIELISVDYSTIFFAEIMIELLKLIYYLNKGSLRTQADVNDIMNDKLFRIYKFFFPMLLKFSKIEERTLGKFLRGHVLIVKGKIS